MHKLNYLYSLYVYICLSTRQNSLFSRCSIEFNKILCLCVSPTVYRSYQPPAFRAKRYKP